MAIQLPDTENVANVLSQLHELGDAKIITSIREPKLLIGLNHWSLWLLVCLSRHVNRQKWVGYIVESRLRGDLREIGNMGAFGHPEDLPRRGTVPDFPEWSYHFHGCGCCLTNEADGAEIDVDFDEEGESTRIDPYFYTNFLDALRKPEFPEWIIKKPEPLHDYWQQDLENLEEMECWKNGRVTDLGMEMGEALTPVIDHFCKLQGRRERESIFQLVCLSLHLGDYINADYFADSRLLTADLFQEIEMGAHSARSQRAEYLSPIVARETGRFGIPLQALAELGPEFSKKQTIECLFHSPVDGAANAALGILNLWQQADFDSILEELVEFRAAEVDSSLVSRVFRWKLKREELGDAMPRNGQFSQVARLLLLRQGQQLKSKIKALLINVLKEVGTASQGEAALLLYILDEAVGLNALGQSLVSKVPMASYEATAACVLIGSNQTKQLLLNALQNANLEQQHAAACALSRFPLGSEIPELLNWMRLQDGIADPVGKDMQFGGRTVQTYSMSDVTHANMQSHIDWAIESFEDLVPLLRKA